MRLRTIVAAATVIFAAGALAAEGDAPQLVRCGGWDCTVTAVEVKGVDTAEAWFLARATEKDAESDCDAQEGDQAKACVADLMGRPPIVVEANCEEGTAGFYGVDPPYKISAKAKQGKLPHAEDPAFWEGEEMSHRARFTVITWFELLCPAAAAKWHIRQEQ
jgi:hypothetical protein